MRRRLGCWVLAALCALPSLAAEPTPAAGAPKRMAILDLQVTGVDAQVGDAVRALMSTEVRRAFPGMEVLSAADIQALIGLEQQKQLMGCSEEESSSCMAELAGALGSERILASRLARLGKLFVLEIRLLDAVKRRTLATATRSVNSEEDLIPALRGAIEEVSMASGSAPRPAAFNWDGVGRIGGVVALLASAAPGAVGVWSAQAWTASARNQEAASGTARDLYEEEISSYRLQTFAASGVAVALAGAGLYLLLRPASPGVSAAVVPVGGGAVVVFGGAWEVAR